MGWLVLMFLSTVTGAQQDQWLRAFPITSYMVPLNDTTVVVQVELPEYVRFKEKQIGLIKGVYESDHADTTQKGYGRCYLIKGDYFYFSISHNTSGRMLKEGDLLYTFMDRTPIHFGLAPKLAAHFIRLQDVYDHPFYDRYVIFTRWTEADDRNFVDSLVADIRFTGEYFQTHDPSMDQVIQQGAFAGKKVLSLMQTCEQGWVIDFIRYMLDRPKLYAGGSWKISEIFATWLTSGAPTPEKE